MNSPAGTVTVPEIETVQRAAALMRERAEKATDGPWDADTRDGLVWAPRLGDPVSGSAEPEDAIHIAGWHPPAALAVACLLERTVETYRTERDTPECPACADGHCAGHAEVIYHYDCGDPVRECECLAPVLDIARTYLRREA